MQFNNQSVIITGASSGIGKATALEFAKRGAKVVVADINEVGGEATVAAIKKAGGQAIFVKTNVAKNGDVQQLVEECISHFGRLDHMINNAGIGRGFCFFDEISDKRWEETIAINQTGVFYCMRAALKVMKAQRKGTIVNTSSLAGVGAAPRMGAYAASKHAVIGMTKTAAVEYGKYNIRINAVCPTIINTPMVEDYLADQPEKSELVKHAIPMRRFGEPSEVAKTICWLCSEESSFINGEEIKVDGGMRA